MTRRRSNALCLFLVNRHPGEEVWPLALVSRLHQKVAYPPRVKAWRALENYGRRRLTRPLIYRLIAGLSRELS